MGLIIPGTLTDTETTDILADFDTAEEIIQVIEDGTYADYGHSLDDLLMVLFSVYNNSSWLDPENADLAHIWADTTSTAAMSSVFTANYGSDEFAELLADIDAFLQAQGPEHDQNAIESGIIVIEEYIAEYGPITTETGSSVTDMQDELTSLIEFFKNVSPYIYLLLYVMEHLGEAVQDGQAVVIEQITEAQETTDELIDDMAGYDWEDGEDRAQLEADQNQLEQVKEFTKAMGEVNKLLAEIIETTLELASAGIQRTSRAASSIISNIGS